MVGKDTNNVFLHIKWNEAAFSFNIFPIHVLSISQSNVPKFIVFWSIVFCLPYIAKFLCQLTRMLNGSLLNRSLNWTWHWHLLRLDIEFARLVFNRVRNRKSQISHDNLVQVKIVGGGKNYRSKRRSTKW